MMSCLHHHCKEGLRDEEDEVDSTQTQFLSLLLLRFVIAFISLILLQIESNFFVGLVWLSLTLFFSLWRVFVEDEAYF
jgi:hypothetical protein